MHESALAGWLAGWLAGTNICFRDDMKKLFQEGERASEGSIDRACI